MCDKSGTVLVDCEAGRQMGCDTYCCRLLVKLRPHEMKPSTDGLPAKGYLGKDSDGLCQHMDRNTWLCSIWDERPEACREYSCNGDFKLQVVLREGFNGIVALARRTTEAYIPRETYISIPEISAAE